MRRFEFVLRIPADEYLRYYRGEAKSVVAEATDGQTVEFPASLLRPHVTRDGIDGRFRLLCDDTNRCIELRRVG